MDENKNLFVIVTRTNAKRASATDEYTNKWHFNNEETERFVSGAHYDMLVVHGCDELFQGYDKKILVVAAVKKALDNQKDKIDLANYKKRFLFYHTIDFTLKPEDAKDFLPDAVTEKFSSTGTSVEELIGKYELPQAPASGPTDLPEPQNAVESSSDFAPQDAPVKKPSVQTPEASVVSPTVGGAKAEDTSKQQGSPENIAVESSVAVSVEGSALKGPIPSARSAGRSPDGAGQAFYDLIHDIPKMASLSLEISLIIESPPSKALRIAQEILEDYRDENRHHRRLFADMRFMVKHRDMSPSEIELSSLSEKSLPNEQCLYDLVSEKGPEYHVFWSNLLALCGFNPEQKAIDKAKLEEAFRSERNGKPEPGSLTIIEFFNHLDDAKTPEAFLKAVKFNIQYKIHSVEKSTLFQEWWENVYSQLAGLKNLWQEQKSGDSRNSPVP